MAVDGVPNIVRIEIQKRVRVNGELSNGNILNDKCCYDSTTDMRFIEFRAARSEVGAIRPKRSIQVT